MLIKLLPAVQDDIPANYKHVTFQLLLPTGRFNPFILQSEKDVLRELVENEIAINAEPSWKAEPRKWAVVVNALEHRTPIHGLPE
jgi:hypothetical protein